MSDMGSGRLGGGEGGSGILVDSGRGLMRRFLFWRVPVDFEASCLFGTALSGGLPSGSFFCLKGLKTQGL
jgi:hypothetical protein